MALGVRKLPPIDIVVVNQGNRVQIVRSRGRQITWLRQPVYFGIDEGLHATSYS